MRFNYHGYSGLTSISSDPGYHPLRSLGSNNAALAKNRKTATEPIHFQNVAGKNFFSLVVMMGAVPKRRVISRRHIGEMTGGQQSAGRLGEEFNPFFGRWLGLRARSERRRSGTRSTRWTSTWALSVTPSPAGLPDIKGVM
jgi:hypothetical protein